MQSTPAVFCAPAFSPKSTPYISAPAIFQDESYPWAVKTPEASPMCWGVTPSTGYGVSQHVAAEPLVPRELLRTMCEPFFEQMLAAVQQALLQKQMETQAMQAKNESFQSLAPPFNTSFYTLSSPVPMVDEESAEADELGAFASLLSDRSSEVESIDAVEPTSPQVQREDSDPTIDAEKSTMVCRHWKSKGWCRMESNCKFLHPEHKRGVGAPKSCSDGCTSGGGISGAACPGMSTISSQPDAISMEGAFPPLSVARRKKRGGKGRSNRGQVARLGELEQEATHELFHAGVACSILA